MRVGGSPLFLQMFWAVPLFPILLNMIGFKWKRVYPKLLDYIDDQCLTFYVKHRMDCENTPTSG